MARRLIAKPEYAKPRDVEAFAQDLKPMALQCRTYGHGMRPFTVTRKKAEGHPTSYYEQVLRCPKCRVRRVMVLSRTGAVITSRYDYTEAPGYLAQGIGRIVGEGRDVLRLENITRLLGEGN